LVKDPRIVEILLSEIDRASSTLARFERVKRIALLDHEFSLASGEVTPTLKLRRHNIAARYRAIIDELYGSTVGEQSASSDS
jgi:long-chain acyl-CoA synthetase